ncbi:MAG: acyltransferase [Akkermansia sp.]
MSATPSVPLLQRRLWIDWLRLAALFMVVCCHCCDPFTFNPDPDACADARLGFWGALWQSALRPCVPLFVCMTGALLLPLRREEDMLAFYRKRIGRVLWPFLIWSVLYNLFPVVAMGLCGASSAQVQQLFVAASEPTASWSAAWASLATIPYDFTGYTTHLWFVFLIIGLYLYLPLFSAWVAQASLRDKLVVLALWAVTLFLPLLGWQREQLFGSCAWNSFGMLYYFAGFSGYLLLGHLVAQLPPCPRPWLRALPLFALGYALTFLGYRVVQTGAVSSGGSLCAMLAQACDPSCAGQPYEPSHEIFLLFCSPQVALMVIAMLLVFRGFDRAPMWMRRALANLTACGFGLYLVHYFFVGPANLLVRSWGTPIALVVPLSALMAFGVTWGVVALLHRLVPGKWFLG